MRDALVWIGVGALGAVGALGRHRVDTAVSARWPSDFPFGTLTANLTGAFAFGVLVGAPAGADALRVVGVGLLGGYTTFSTWMFETERLAEDGEWRLAWLNLVGPTLAGLAAAALGWLLGAGIA